MPFSSGQKWHQHTLLFVPRWRDPYSSTFLYINSLLPFSWLNLVSGLFRYQLLCMLLSHFFPRKSCNYHGLFAVQEVNGFNILASNFSSCSNLLVFTTSSYVLISFVSHFFLRSAWIPWSITSNILLSMSSTSFPHYLSVKIAWRIPTLDKLNLTQLAG